MKLRNKKTGEVVEINKIGLVWNKYGMPAEIGQYDSIAELCDEWEDYNPKEPLIKDEKIRKAVRAWWEAVSGAMADKRILYKKSQDFAVGIYTICCGAIYSEVLEDGKMYTIEELCGEDED